MPRGVQKNKGIAEARQMAMYLIRKLTNLSLPDIGREFARDHSTVLHAIRKVEVALKDGNENMKPMKNRSTGRIDIAVAWIIAMATWMLKRNEGPDLADVIAAGKFSL